MPYPVPSTLDLIELQLETSPAITLAARELLLEYGEFVAAQPAIATFCYGALQQEAASLPSSYLDQRGGSILALADSEPVGFVAWRSLPSLEPLAAWELKRLWIRPQARSFGAGRILVEAVFARARAAGRKHLFLDTAPQSMAAAVRLYASLGFVPCPSYNGTSAFEILYMRKDL